MMWASWGEFWAMGGYGLYVWGSYGAAFIVILIEIISLGRGHKQTLKRLKRMKAWESQ
ncbi:MAG: heme exporter protein CcmD [Gallionellaceae bacterium]|nr:heme exporter protein CcmD [Gallionellaceae bacterium]MDD5366716.1 heme exporter protein CcmD [Gallionellaceae bacterium]